MSTSASVEPEMEQKQKHAGGAKSSRIGAVMARWTTSDEDKLRASVAKHYRPGKRRDWEEIAVDMPGRTASSLAQRWLKMKKDQEAVEPGTGTGRKISLSNTPTRGLRTQSEQNLDDEEESRSPAVVQAGKNKGSPRSPQRIWSNAEINKLVGLLSEVGDSAFEEIAEKLGTGRTSGSVSRKYYRMLEAGQITQPKMGELWQPAVFPAPGSSRKPAAARPRVRTAATKWDSDANDDDSDMDEDDSDSESESDGHVSDGDPPYLASGQPIFMAATNAGPAPPSPHIGQSPAVKPKARTLAPPKSPAVASGSGSRSAPAEGSAPVRAQTSWKAEEDALLLQMQKDLAGKSECWDDIATAVTSRYGYYRSAGASKQRFYNLRNAAKEGRNITNHTVAEAKAEERAIAAGEHGTPRRKRGKSTRSTGAGQDGTTAQRKRGRQSLDASTSGGGKRRRGSGGVYVDGKVEEVTEEQEAKGKGWCTIM